MTYQANGRATAPSPSPTLARPLLRRSAAALLLTASAGLLAPACAENESSLFIRHCVPRTFQEGQGCTTPEPGEVEVFLGRGNLDLVFQGGYSCDLLLGNQIVERGSSDQVRTETSRINLYSADVRLIDLAGNAISYSDGSAIEFSVPVSGFVDPADNTEPGYGYAQVLLIDAAAAEGIGRAAASTGATDVMAGIIVYGRTLGGQELETPEWFFPITVCLGCSCSEPPDGCDGDMSNSGTENLSFCSTDQAVDCRVGQGFLGPAGEHSCDARIASAAAYYSGM